MPKKNESRILVNSIRNPGFQPQILCKYPNNVLEKQNYLQKIFESNSGREDICA
jgi:hypothetical protein